MASIPTQRTMKELKSMGFTSAIVEHFNPWVRRRQDLFGFADILAVREGVGVLLIQTTSESGNHAARRTKIIAEPRAAACLAAGARIEIWSWSKRCKDGVRGARKLWTLRREEVTAEMVAGVNERREG